MAHSFYLLSSLITKDLPDKISRIISKSVARVSRCCTKINNVASEKGKGGHTYSWQSGYIAVVFHHRGSMKTIMYEGVRWLSIDNAKQWSRRRCNK